MQSVPQAIPTGRLVTVPVPLPLLVTARVRFGRKVAVTLCAASIVTAHGSVPVQVPAVQPVKV